jgi:hypothetical protein
MPDTRIRLANDRSISRTLRRRYLKLAASGARAREAEQKATSRKLQALSSVYGKNVAGLIGADAFREYRALRKELENATRTKRLRASNSFLDEVAFDRMRLRRLRHEYFEAARSLLPDFAVDLDDVRGVKPLDCSPWVEHRAPFAGEFDWPTFTKKGDVNAPTFTHSANATTGVLRSGIRIGVSGAGDDDQMSAEHEAGFTTWHTTLESGRIEGFVVYEFRQRAIYKGEISDEWGISDGTRSQLARARIRVYANSGPVETLESLIFGETEFHWGDDDLWSRGVGNARDLHWFYFSTTRSYPQGSPIVLEAGIWNAAWFQVNDMSIDMTNDLDLRLDKIMLRSCP